MLKNKKRVKTPTLIQMEAVECGAASLGIIMHHYGCFISLEKLRYECGVSRDGSKASNILKAARRFGFEAKGFRREPEALKQMAFPLIIFWNFNHFLVLEGFSDNKAFLNDPAYGPRTVSIEEFDQSFTGIVLTIEPGADFKKIGTKPSIISSLKPRLAGNKLALSYLIIAGLALVVPGLIMPTFSRVFIDNVLVSGLESWIKPLLIGMGITALLLAGITTLQQHYLLRLETKLALSTSSRFFWHILRLPTVFFSQRSAGEIGNRVAINDTVARLLSGDLATTVINVMLIGFYAVLMAQYDLLMTAVGVGIALLNFIFLRYVGKKMATENQRLVQEYGKLIGTAMNGLQSIETLKASGAESDFFARWSGFQIKVANAEQRMGVLMTTLMAVPPFLMAVNTAAILGTGGLRIMEGTLTMGMLVAFQVLMQCFLAPVNQMINLGSSFQKAKGDMNRLDDVLNYPVVQESGESNELSCTEQVKLTGQLELHDVTFGYNTLEAPLIEGFSLTLTPGSRVALVGGSGSGKSTVAKVITGLYNPWSGEIRFDGKQRDELPQTLLSNSVAMVDQDISMFSGTIRENLTLWDDTIPEAQVLQAAKDAVIHDDIAARPNGYDCLIEEGGSNFSGGQRQRMEIARALTTNPSILILDEATSALDPMTEQLVDEHIRRRGCTCLIVAHRLSTIRDCDEIIVLDKGKIVERGTHYEMKDKGGPYSRLIHA